MACACSPPVSPASAHVTPCGRPMRPPIQAHLMERWAAITTFQGPNRSRPGALLGGGSDADPAASSPTSPEAMFPHSRPLTTSPIPLSTARLSSSLALSLSLCLCLCLHEFSPGVCSSILCAMHSVHCTRCFCLLPNEGRTNRSSLKHCPRPTMATPTSPTPIEQGTCSRQATEV